MKKVAINTIGMFVVFVIMELIKGERLSFVECLVIVVVIGVVMSALEWLWRVYDKQN